MLNMQFQKLLGQLNVVLKPEKTPVVIEDLQLEAKYNGLSYDLVMDGIILDKNLQKIGKNRQWLQKEVKKFGFKPEEALIVTLNEKGDMFCQKKGKLIFSKYKQLIFAIFIIIIVIILDIIFENYSKNQLKELRGKSKKFMKYLKIMKEIMI